MKSICKFVYRNILGWHMVGQFPELDKYVVIVAPHTSWHDFYLGLLLRAQVDTRIHFMAKKELFVFPFGWFFRKIGGAPLDRSGNQDKVKQIASLFQNQRTFKLAMAPEGTRKKVTSWRTGFYFVAKLAKVPVVMVVFDYAKKEHRISEPFYTTTNQAEDFRRMQAFYKGAVGKIPEYS
ncbi:MAG: 1-acyl-sn-glycerol-3-phosphate acyltransferase [Flavobacteriaceae bacterium]|nr:1-acyl-sn-glycerol-3-phosphate acyltransferase [Flavobacteriaceae bacterium]